MKWLYEAIRSSRTSLASSTRVIALASAATLCISTLVLTAGSFWHPEMLPVVMALGPSLAGMATVGYGMNRWATKGATNEQPTE